MVRLMCAPPPENFRPNADSEREGDGKSGEVCWIVGLTLVMQVWQLNCPTTGLENWPSGVSRKGWQKQLLAPIREDT